MGPVMRERRIEQRLAERVKALGGVAVKMVPTIAGLPDRLVLLPNGVARFVELKSPTGRLRPVQQVWHERLDRLGHPVAVLSSTDQVDRWIDEGR